MSFHDDYAVVLENILNGEPFSFARFNDGEMSAIALGRRFEADEEEPGHTYAVARGEQRPTKQLAADLQKCLASFSPQLVIGLCCPHCYPAHYEEGERLRDCRTPVVNANILQNGTWRVTCATLRLALQREPNRPFLWIGGGHQSVSGVAAALGRTPRFLAVPQTDAHTDVDLILDALMDCEEGTLVGLSCGPTSRIIAVRSALMNLEITALDLGSLLDPWSIGVRRGYHMYYGKVCDVCAGPPIIDSEPNIVDRSVRILRKVIPNPRTLWDRIR